MICTKYWVKILQIIAQYNMITLGFLLQYFLEFLSPLYGRSEYFHYLLLHDLIVYLNMWDIAIFPIYPKKFDFPIIYANASHTLSEAQNGLKKGFYSIFVVGWTKICILKCVFLAFFVAKMTKIDIQNQKQIVTNDYQQFLAHSEWLLSFFQISYAKHEFLLIKLKVHKNGISWAKNLI